MLMSLARQPDKRFVSLWLAALIIASVGCGSSSAPSEMTPPPPPATPALTRLSSDPYSNAGSRHATEVEPGAFAFGSTIVSAFQVARISAGGGADIGFATSIRSEEHTS